MTARKAIARGLKNSQNKSLDPLYIIFEQHLSNFQDPEIDRKTFVATVIKEYLDFLRKKSIAVPQQFEQPIIEELAEQVNTMLVKRIYGCFDIKEFRQTVVESIKRRPRYRSKRMLSKE